MAQGKIRFEFDEVYPPRYGIVARGGEGGRGGPNGGAGSGGAVRLVANRTEGGPGLVDVSGAYGWGGAGSPGRVRIEAPAGRPLTSLGGTIA